MTKEEIDRFRKTAMQRFQGHRKHASQRDMAKGEGDWKGIVGEVAFAERYGLAVNLEDKPRGDGGRDFWVWINGVHTGVDIKAAAIPKWLFVEAVKCKPENIYVLAHFLPGDTLYEDRAVLMGWEWGHVMNQLPVTDETGRGIMHHAKLRRELRTIYELDDLVGWR